MSGAQLFRHRLEPDSARCLAVDEHRPERPSRGQLPNLTGREGSGERAGNTTFRYLSRLRHLGVGVPSPGGLSGR